MLARTGTRVLPIDACPLTSASRVSVREELSGVPLQCRGQHASSGQSHVNERAQSSKSRVLRIVATA